MSDRVRMTAQSKVDIKAANSAKLLRHDGGYKVVLKGASGKTIDVQTGEDVTAVYPSMSAAKKAVQRHNPALFHVDLEPRI